MSRFYKSFFAIGGLFVWFIGPGPLYPYRKAFLNKQPVQLILVLGGDIKREYAGIDLARKLSIPLILSGGSNPEHAKWLISKSNIPTKLVKLDYRAHDTLSNFTSLIDEIKFQGIRHTLLVTSEDHLPRAMNVGRIIAGSRGIKITSLSVPCKPYCQVESFQKHISDVVRAIAWVSTGKDLRVIAGKAWKTPPSKFF